MIVHYGRDIYKLIFICYTPVKSKLRQLERQISLKNHVDSKEHSTKESFPDVDGPWQNLPRNASQFSKKVMIKYKEQTNKIVSTFRPPHVSVNIKHIGRSENLFTMVFFIIID